MTYTKPLNFAQLWDQFIQQNAILYQQQGRQADSIDLEFLSKNPHILEARHQLGAFWKKNADIKGLTQNVHFVHWLGYLSMSKFNGVYGLDHFLHDVWISAQKNHTRIDFPISTEGYGKSSIDIMENRSISSKGNRIGFLLDEHDFDFAGNSDVWSEMYHPDYPIQKKTPSSSIYGKDVVIATDDIKEHGEIFECLHSNWSIKAVLLSCIANSSLKKAAINICEFYEIPYIVDQQLISDFSKDKHTICTELYQYADSHNQHFFCTCPSTLQLLKNEISWFSEQDRIDIEKYQQENKDK